MGEGGEGDAVEDITVSLDFGTDTSAGLGLGFDAGVYMGALRAGRFGRWMLWSPRLCSTHDLVVQIFDKLRIDCVACVQFKGRGK
ncbi:hypothetical protein GUJ93_ZPchr0012g21722 [Zizania palustris]|uniref:Uncharacterized protein n=1 Tax=Zizania palustris TaxID=103762 RepID=A0A8J6BVR6_ZIZPA|nr:hypothetical protein GUJ93_ZPchr0012g21722 [Zizania palustris]